MRKRPEKRYQSAEEMALDIKRYLVRQRRARRLQIPVPTLGQRAPRSVVVKRDALSVAGYIALSIIIALAVASLFR